MAGYNYRQGMSNNAVSAYNAGKTALSNVTRDVLDAHDIAIPVWFAKTLLRTEIGACEWHHCGGKGFYNEVDFYDIEALKAFLSAASEAHLAELKAHWQQYRGHRNSVHHEPEEAVYGYWEEWGGSRNYKRIVGHIAFVGTLRADWITLQDGKRKKASGKGLRYAPIHAISDNSVPFDLPENVSIYPGCECEMGDILEALHAAKQAKGQRDAERQRAAKARKKAKREHAKPHAKPADTLAGFNETTVQEDVSDALSLLSEILEEWHRHRTHPEYAEAFAKVEGLLTTDIFAAIAEAQDILEAAKVVLDEAASIENWEKVSDG